MRRGVTVKDLEYKNASRRNLTLTAAVIALSILVVITAAYARYEMSFDDSELKMEAISGSVYLYGDSVFKPLSSWKYDKTTGEYTVDAIISNAADRESFCPEDQSALLEVFVSLGIASPDNITMTLTADNIVYTATPTAVEKNSPLYISNGEGWLYKFCNKAGEELSLTLKGGEVSERKVSIKISGETVEPALVRLIVSGKIK